MPLTSTELKTLKLLRSSGKRDRHRFIAEGVRVLEESVRHRVSAEMIFVCDEVLSDRGKTLAGRMAKLGGVVRKIPSRQLDALTDAKTAQGIAAVFACPTSLPVKPAAQKARRILVCDGISDPGNLGTLFRSALAFGFGDVLVTGDSVDSFSPKVVRASSGAIFGLNVVQAESSKVVHELQSPGVVLLAADASGEPLSVIKRRHKLSGNVAIAIGAEARGVSEVLLKAAAAKVGIRHETAVESLNAAVAGSILMKEMYEI